MVRRSPSPVQKDNAIGKPIGKPSPNPSVRARNLDAIKRNYQKLRKKALRTKKLQHQKRLEKGLSIAKFTVHRNTHLQMKELARRHQRQRGMFIDGFYVEALREYLRDKEIPKRMTKRDRGPVSIQATNELLNLLDDVAKIAYKEEIPSARIIELALDEYLNKPENYLGKAFHEANPEHYEAIR